MDKMYQQKEDEWRAKKRAAKNKKEQPEEALAFDASYKPFKQQKKDERRTIGSHLRHNLPYMP